MGVCLSQQAEREEEGEEGDTNCSTVDVLTRFINFFIPHKTRSRSYIFVIGKALHDMHIMRTVLLVYIVE
jgi:hypothetical protein